MISDQDRDAIFQKLIELVRSLVNETIRKSDQDDMVGCLDYFETRFREDLEKVI